MDRWVEFLRAHRWKILLVTWGVLVAILLMTIGFWRTMLLLLLVGLGLGVGTVLDRGGMSAVSAFFSKLFEKDGGK